VGHQPHQPHGEAWRAGLGDLAPVDQIPEGTGQCVGENFPKPALYGLT
jgi:hypothetical protein